MNELKIMFIEDSEEAQESFIGVVDVFNRKNHQHNLKVEYKIATDLVEASNIIDGSYDGAIIDLKLGDDDEAGNRIVKELYETFTRIPIIFVTAYADLVNDHPSVIKIRRREDGTYESDLLLFQQIREIGLTDIIGGRGQIEQQLHKVFLDNLLPQIDTWISYGETYKEIDPKRTERALLRYTLNHLFQYLEEDKDNLEEDKNKCFPEEVYLYPPIPKKITTGSMVKEDNQWFVVLSPACDLVIRNGQINTERILFVAVEKEADIVDKACNRLKKITNDEKREEEKNDILQKLSGNNRAFYYHWLPPVKFNISEGGHLDFEGGFLNFRKLEALPLKKFKTRFKDPSIQISPFFVKDIVSRFSSYYARQGQPDIDNKDFIDHYTS